MPKLVEGMSVMVLPCKPDWRLMHPNYVTGMDKYAGKVFKVSQIDPVGGIVYLFGTNNYAWNQAWLVPLFNED